MTPRFKGKGELGFEFQNLNHVQATVVEPRPLSLKKPLKKLALGIYGRNVALSQWDVPGVNITATAAAAAAEGMCTAAAVIPKAARVSSAPASAAPPAGSDETPPPQAASPLPHHLRTFFDCDLIEWSRNPFPASSANSTPTTTAGHDAQRGAGSNAGVDSQRRAREQQAWLDKARELARIACWKAAGDEANAHDENFDEGGCANDAACNCAPTPTAATAAGAAVLDTLETVPPVCAEDSPDPIGAAKSSDGGDSNAKGNGDGRELKDAVEVLRILQNASCVVGKNG